MRSQGSIHRFIGLLGLGMAFQLACMSSSRADVISTSPTLPLLGVPYLSAGGVGCFPIAGFCIQAGSLTLTSVVSSTFPPQGQDILADATYAGVLTNLGHIPIGLVTLTGTLEMIVLGRSSPTALGSWVTDLVSLDLSGPLNGHTLTLGLDGSHSSAGNFSVAEGGAGNERLFRISSFFDVFVELHLDSTPPLTTDRGPVTLTLTPEPIGLLVLMPALLGLTIARRRGWPPMA